MAVFRMPLPGQRSRPTPGPPSPGPAPGSHTPSGSPAPRPGIAAGFLAPHPPQLIYSENPPQNEPTSTGGWETLRWGYQEVRRRIREEIRPDVLVVHAPHWITMVGHHVNCVPNPRGVSIEPIFPHLFRYHYDFTTDVELAEAIADEAEAGGLLVKRMRHPGVRVDYATIGSLHLVNDAWDIPVVSLSANNNPYFYADAALDQMHDLGAATLRAVERTGRRAVLIASNTLSHMHWDREPQPPEDMSKEHPYDQSQYEWDMRFLAAARAGDGRRFEQVIGEHIEATASETKAGSLTWMQSAMGWPDVPGDVIAFGTVIGTGNAIVHWPGQP